MYYLLRWSYIERRSTFPNSLIFEATVILCALNIHCTKIYTVLFFITITHCFNYDKHFANAGRQVPRTTSIFSNISIYSYRRILSLCYALLRKKLIITKLDHGNNSFSKMWWKCCPHYWPFLGESDNADIGRSSIAWTSCWTNIRFPGDSRRHVIHVTWLQWFHRKYCTSQEQFVTWYSLNGFHHMRLDC